MVTYIDGHKDRFGVEPICAVLPISPSTYYTHKVLQQHPDRRSDRARADGWLTGEIERVWEDNYRVYGVRKVWRQLKREGVTVARCTVARLMRELGLQGVVRGRRIKTTLPDETSERPLDRVLRYAECLTEVGIESSVGSVGDSYDNALAETINGLYKTEVIRQQGP